MLLREINESDFVKIGRLLSSKQGAEVLDILSSVFYNTVSFTPDSPGMTAFKEGQRDIVQILRRASSAVGKQEEET